MECEGSPHFTRLIAAMLTAYTLSDALQLAMEAAKQRVEAASESAP